MEGIQSGQLTNDGQTTTLAFSMREDESLNGYFVDFEAVTVLPEFGSLAVSESAEIFNYVPEAHFFGADQFRYRAIDQGLITVTIEVVSVPDAPSLRLDLPETAEQGRLFSVILEASDPDPEDAGSIVFIAENLPEWLSLDPQTGVLSGVPQQSDVGIAEGITLGVRDPSGLEGRIDNLSLEVIDINDPPLINTTQIPLQWYGREALSFNVFPDDREGDAVTVSIQPNDLFSADVQGGQVNLQVSDVNAVSNMTLTVVARDERGAVTRESLPIIIYPRTESGKGVTIRGVRDGRGIHLVILGDGYAADEQVTFAENVGQFIGYMSADEGIADHLDAFNIHRIETISQDSGVDDNDMDDTRQTAFDSAYNCKSIQRLICADRIKLFRAGLAEYTVIDQIILLVNDRRYGGSGNSGGQVAITSAAFPEIAVHEMGHSLANLADEYVDPLILEISGQPAFVEGFYRNVSMLNDPLRVPWAHWIDTSAPIPQLAGDEGVGIFEGALYQQRGVFRPTFDSRMRTFDRPFGPVNAEQWILQLYTLTQGVRSISPLVFDVEVPAGETQQFAVEPLFDSEVQLIEWRLNGQILSGLSEFGVPGSLSDDLQKLELTLPVGSHRVDLTVSDISGRIRLPTPHAGIFNRSWQVRVQ